VRFKIFILLVLISVNSWLSSTTWEIKQDGTGNFTTIQEGIDASVNSDTVLVYPGTYYENIIYNGKNIMVASLELTTGDEAYIDSTIIDGQRLDSCVRIMDQETDAYIQGITLTNGQGHQSQYSGCNRGGGILIDYQSTFNITNCMIKRNYAISGGGIYVRSNSNINISGTSIIYNYASTTAGGLMVDDSQCVFDADNRCNIYDNFGASGIDIYICSCEYLDVIVDTFSILTPTRYFANHIVTNLHPNTYTFDIFNYSLEQVNHDLYVSMLGDDNNSGLSADEPMKTINHAIRKIVSDSLNPKTIHLESGIYSENLNNQFFAIGGKSFIKIIGEDAETTIIDGELNYHPLLLIGPGAKKCFIKNLTFQNNTYYLFTLFFSNRDEVYLENLIIQNNVGTEHGIVLLNNLSKAELKNVKILSNSATDIVEILALPDCDSISVIDCVIKNNYAGGTFSLCGGLQATSTGDILIENTVFSGNELIATDWTSASALALGGFASTSGKFTISNCLFENNQCYGTADKTVLLDCYDDIEINNSTFVDNSSTYTLSLIRNHIGFHNNILRNNCNYEIVLADNTPWGYTSEIDISHCNIQGGQNAIYNQNNANIINWLEGNIDEDPLFLLSGDDPYQLTLGSPCIDTGTPDTTGLFIPPWDLLYNQRVWDGDGNGVSVIDMGCYEFGAEQYLEAENIQFSIFNIQLSNYPNPFNPLTTIKFNLIESGKVKLIIYNIKGQKVKTLIKGTQQSGSYTIIWDGKDDSGKQVCSGIYFYKMKTDDKTIATRKCLLLK